MPLQSPKNLIETAATRLFKRGGPSSSDTLNDYHRRIVADLARLAADSQAQARREQLLTVLLTQQAAGMQALAAHLTGLLGAAPAGEGLVDFWSTAGVADANTAGIDRDYGQATLPVLSVTEKMFGTALDGSLWVPEDARIRYLAAPDWTPGQIPPDDAFQASPEDYLGLGDQPDAFFLGGDLPTASYLFVKLVLPETMSVHRLANRVTFTPLPCFAHTLVGAYYRSTDGAWRAIDLAYLPGYDAGRGAVPLLGPCRLHFPPAEVTQVALVLRAAGWWGVSEAGVQLAEYGGSATLAVDFSAFAPGTIGAVTLDGRDPAVLSGYAQSVAGSEVDVTLTQAAAYTSPVVTGVHARW